MAPPLLIFVTILWGALFSPSTVLAVDGDSPLSSLWIDPQPPLPNPIAQRESFRTTASFPRRDPLNSFKLYDGGFNIKDPHYWSSVVFTGTWAFVLAFSCLLLGIATSVWWCVEDSRTCTATFLPSHSNSPCGLYYFVIIQFCVLAITSAGVIFWGSYESGKQITESTNIIVWNVDTVINQVEHAVYTVEGISSPLMTESLNSTIQDACHKLNNAAQGLQINFRDGKEEFNRIFKYSKALLALSATMIPAIVLIGFVAILKAWFKALKICFVVMVIVLFVSWLFSGVCFIVSNVATDACQAMKNYNENPEDSAFSKLLPCLTSRDANRSLDSAKYAIKNLFNQMNGAIDIINEREQMMRDLYPNGTFNITLKHFCDPFGPPPDYEEIQCSPGDSNFSTFETDYVNYICDEDIVKHCLEKNTPIPITYYSEFRVSLSTAKEVIKILPTLYGIVTCDFIKAAFQNLTEGHCGELKTAFNSVWVGFTVASIAMMALQLIWVAIRKQLRGSKQIRRQQGFTCYFSGLP